MRNCPELGHRPHALGSGWSTGALLYGRFRRCEGAGCDAPGQLSRVGTVGSVPACRLSVTLRRRAVAPLVVALTTARWPEGQSARLSRVRTPAHSMTGGLDRAATTNERLHPNGATAGRRWSVGGRHAESLSIVQAVRPKRSGNLPPGGLSVLRPKAGKLSRLGTLGVCYNWDRAQQCFTRGLSAGPGRGQRFQRQARAAPSQLCLRQPMPCRRRNCPNSGQLGTGGTEPGVLPRRNCPKSGQSQGQASRAAPCRGCCLGLD